MALRVYNSLTQQKEKFVPIKTGKVGMYVCGITAYDACHLGHARAAVSFDVIYRTLKYLGFDVTYVRNYTDIDDKIINRSKETNTEWKALTERYIAEYQEDMKLLNVAAPTVEPKATGHIEHMIEAIAKLIKNGKAYESQGSVYYAVREFKGYGKLSHKDTETLKAGARIEIDETKKDPLDFALWKRAKPGEPEWKSPWGPGRPGWHIECSVMSTHYLGQPFDIHGGGRDLIFPHHENEIAQAEGVSSQPFCNYFLHNGFININAEKMSKSLRNFKTIKEVVVEHDPEVVRFFLISANYGSPLDYTEQNMETAKSMLDRYYLFCERLKAVAPVSLKKAPKATGEVEKELEKSLKGLSKKFEEAIADDFNTPQVLGALFETVRIFNKYLDQGGESLKEFGGWANGEWEKSQKNFRAVLGVFTSEPKDYLKRIKEVRAKTKEVDVAWIEKKIEERRQARQAKDFKKGDLIREALLKLGIEIKDRPDGTTEWHLK